MGLGGMMFAILSLLGLGTVLTHAPNAFFLMRILGACYLAFLAFNIWRKAAEVLKFDDDGSELVQSSGLLSGFGVQVANPKTIIVYSSVFIAALPEDLHLGIGLFLVFSVFLLEFCWYAFVASVFSADAPRRVYARAKLGVDRSAAFAMGCLATKVAWDALQSIRT
jgi:threonine/homoserine/homoserine lactone efflux protein